MATNPNSNERDYPVWQSTAPSPIWTMWPILKIANILMAFLVDSTPMMVLVIVVTIILTIIMMMSTFFSLAFLAVVLR